VADSIAWLLYGVIRELDKGKKGRVEGMSLPCGSSTLPEYVVVPRIPMRYIS
jgi:hypothetical protein